MRTLASAEESQLAQFQELEQVGAICFLFRR